MHIVLHIVLVIPICVALFALRSNCTQCSGSGVYCKALPLCSQIAFTCKLFGHVEQIFPDFLNGNSWLKCCVLLARSSFKPVLANYFFYPNWNWMYVIGHCEILTLLALNIHNPGSHLGNLSPLQSKRIGKGRFQKKNFYVFEFITISKTWVL